MCKDAQRSLVAHVDIRVVHIILRAITDFASPVHKSHSSISISDLPRMFIQTTLFRKYLNYSEARLQKMLSCPLSLFRFSSHLFVVNVVVVVVVRLC